MRTLILGGVRSGKSRLAETLAQQRGLPVTYIATATANDHEMQARIDSHRAHRPEHWTVIEEPIALGNLLRNRVTHSQCIIVDCLTLWLTNLLMSNNEKQLRYETDSLLTALDEKRGEVLLVSNETGMGVIPCGELAREYCDEAGRLHQQLTALCDRVVLTVAGLPMVLKGEVI
jgi:adenosylcobinamide kinase/adenosylcobinamide-phosphate guanylyltransferase